MFQLFVTLVYLIAIFQTVVVTETEENGLSKKGSEPTRLRRSRRFAPKMNFQFVEYVGRNKTGKYFNIPTGLFARLSLLYCVSATRHTVIGFLQQKMILSKSFLRKITRCRSTMKLWRRMVRIRQLYQCKNLQLAIGHF